MPALAYSLPAFPGFEGPKTYAAWPVWSNSTTKEIRFQPISKKAAVRLFHRARDFDRQTNRPGHHGGAVGPTALQVLHTLIFDFLNYASGRLDPSHAAIAHAANLCERAVRKALKRLRELGILNWVRRCAESWRDGLPIAQRADRYLETRREFFLRQPESLCGLPAIRPGSSALRQGQQRQRR